MNLNQVFCEIVQQDQSVVALTLNIPPPANSRVMLLYAFLGKVIQSSEFLRNSFSSNLLIPLLESAQIRFYQLLTKSQDKSHVIYKVRSRFGSKNTESRNIQQLRN